MSSEIYELMKRSDEVAVVEKAHLHPRFVEDVRARDDPPRRRGLPAAPRRSGFLLARQENLETIHRHSVVAERSGELAEILAELDSGEHSRRHVTKREWLEAPCAAGLSALRSRALGGRRGRRRSSSASASMWARRPKK